MASDRASGTQGYAEDAAALIARYDGLAFADVHKAILHLIPAAPCDALDIGAGSGRDAAALAAMGHRVVAVEPTDALRRHAMARHQALAIDWLDDSLPDLAVLRERRTTFDLVMLTAVWMHLDLAQRRAAMPRVAALLRAGGVLTMTLRHGEVPAGRRMFEVSAAETLELARAQGLEAVLNARVASVQAGNADVSWTRLAFVRAGPR
ncbi:MAG: class I SAM-dependent methyltransferase [Alphaproteobacteria bacterium]|nr:class I SAM-dependent methyltransferase [Alphaproteobacteria bacterium]